MSQGRKIKKIVFFSWFQICLGFSKSRRPTEPKCNPKLQKLYQVLKHKFQKCLDYADVVFWENESVSWLRIRTIVYLRNVMVMKEQS